MSRTVPFDIQLKIPLGALRTQDAEISGVRDGVGPAVEKANEVGKGCGAVLRHC